MSWETGPYTTEPGPRRQNGKLVMWSEDGFLYCQWADGEKDVLELPDARSRLQAVAGEMAIWEARKDHGGPGIDRAYAREMYYNHRRNMENLRDCIKDAEAQGDSTDPQVKYQKVKAFLRSKRVSLMGDTRRVVSPGRLAEQLIMPVTYSRLPDYVPKPRTGVLMVDAPPTPPT